MNKDTQINPVEEKIENGDAPALRIQDLSAGYNGIPVIHDIDLTVEQGEFFGLMGLNGAGKTTLIKTILGLMTPEKGEIATLSLDRFSIEAKKNIAYLPERFDPPWFLSGLEFLKFSAALYKRKLKDEDFYEAADRLALDRDALKRRVQTYSKGMRQKLGLLATILTGCKLLILDEPMSGLDPKARAQVKDYLTSLKADNRTIFLSSHILADMDEICDRVSVLHDGHIRFTGAPQDLKKKTGAKNLERAFLDHIGSGSSAGDKAVDNQAA